LNLNLTKLIKHFLLTFSFVLIFFKITFPQSLSFHNYTTDEGLPQNTVFSILQDSTGFIWVGTEAGVARFDGSNFKTFGIADGLIATDVLALFQDSKGNIWMGTKSGVSVYSQNNFTNYTQNDGLADDFIYAITEDKKGNIWFATRSSGLMKFSDSTFTKITKKDGLSSNRTRALITDQNGNLWIGTDGRGIVKYDGNKFTKYTTANGLVNNKVSSIFEDSRGDIWIGTYRGISKFDGEKFTNFTQADGVPQVIIRTINEDIYGNLWFGTYGSGLLTFNGDKFKKFVKSGMESRYIQSSILDERGDLWFGTFLGGLSRLPADWFEIYNKSNKLADDAVFAISEDEAHNIYFGHFGSGITKLTDNSVEYITKKNGLLSDKVSAIYFDKNSDLWVGTFNGITYFHNNNISYLTKDDGLYNNIVLSIGEDASSNVWFGCEGGVSKYSRIAQKITNSYSSKSGFGEGWINDIYKDKSGNLWFATETNGVIKYDGRNFFTYDTSNGLDINNIFTIDQDQNGNFWFATNGKGIIKFDGKTFTDISSKDGLSADVCYFAIENNGKIYVGTTNGLTIFDYLNYDKLGRLAFKYFGKSDGLPNKEFNQGAYFEDSRGNLWFGTQKGAVKINPQRKPRKTSQKLFLNKIIISDGESESTFNQFLNQNLKYNQNNITFDFFTISFNQPYQTVFEIKLDGIEDKWSETREHKVSYRALPPGNYKFKVRVINSDGEKSPEYILSSFKINPPYYLTWWFITLSVLFILLLIYNIYYYKTQQVRKRNIELGEMVKERTKALEIEKNKSDELLLNILPASSVEELKLNGKVRPREFKHVSILFTDFKDFTYTASVLPAESLVDELNDIFREFDEIMEKYNIEKLKTVGDSYMAAAGLPNETEDHAVKIVYAALEMRELIKHRNKTAAIKWEMRAGIHSGSVIAGVVGTKKFTYDIWGDTVNIASRMESSGEPGEINISGYTYMLIKDYFDCEYRGKVDAKGKGYIDMYFVNGIKSEKKEELNSHLNPSKI